MNTHRVRDVSILVVSHVVSFLVIWYWGSLGTFEWVRIEKGLHIVVLWTVLWGMAIGFASLWPLRASWPLPGRLCTSLLVQPLGYFLLFLFIARMYPLG